MNQNFLKYLFPAIILLSFMGCKKDEVPIEQSENPAEVNNLVTEISLTTITLTSSAEQRLGIETSVVEYRSVERSRTFGGEVVPVSGGSVTVR